MIHLVTFATDDMSRAAELCYLTAMQNGVQRAFLKTPHAVHRLPCYSANRSVFDAPRGAGLWAWKPALIDWLLTNAFVNDIRENDILIYADAGIEFIDNVNYIIDRMDQDIFLFGNMWEHAHWCKRDIVEAIWPLTPEHLQMAANYGESAFGPFWQEMGWTPRFGKQVQASVIFFRVSDFTRKFVKEWLDWCLFESGRLIDDSPSRTPNHPEFRENRHDQAILTTMAYRDGIKLHAWPAVYNRDMEGGGFTYPRDGYPKSDDYPSLFFHHRRRNAEWDRAAQAA